MHLVLHEERFAKLRRIEALFARPGTQGERGAAKPRFGFGAGSPSPPRQAV